MANSCSISAARPELHGIGQLWVPTATGRIDAAQAAEILGFQEHDIPALVGHGLLKPLGKPATNARKYFAAVEIRAHAEDAKWLSKATQVLYDHWQEKNANRRPTGEESAEMAS